MGRGRPRTSGANLPLHVYRIANSRGVAYHYYCPKGLRGPRYPLGKDVADIEFWRRYKEAKDGCKVTVSASEISQSLKGTFAALILDYRGLPEERRNKKGGLCKHYPNGAPEWNKLAEATQRDYNRYLDWLVASAGDRMVEDLTSADVYQLRNQWAATPVAGNTMLSVLITLLKFGIPRNYCKTNAAREVEKLDIDEEEATEPWSEEAYCYVRKHAPEDIRRMALLGRATGQRRVDLVQMRGVDLADDGIWVRVQKVRKRLKKKTGADRHFVPLLKAEVTEIRSWGVTDLDYFLKSPEGNRYTGDGLYQRFRRWLAKPDAKPLANADLRPHGLRAMAIFDRRRAGLTDGQIADELCISVQMVSRYLRLADKTASARESRDFREKKSSGRTI